MSNIYNGRFSEIIHDNACNIVSTVYDGAHTLLPTIEKCSLQDGIIRALRNTGLLDCLVMRGGTAIQRIYKGPRLSDNLEFCLKNEMSGQREFASFCTSLARCLRYAFAQVYGIEAEIFYRSRTQDRWMSRNGDVYTWKVGFLVKIGGKHRLVKIDVCSSSPCTCSVSMFHNLVGDHIHHDSVFVHVVSKEEIAIDKFITIMSDRRVQYKNIFDFGIICPNAGVNEELIEKKCRGYYTGDGFLKHIASRTLNAPKSNAEVKNFHRQLQWYLTKEKVENIVSDIFITYTVLV